MAYYLKDEDLEIRRLVEGLDRHQELEASSLGVSRSAISHRLNTEKHGAWWRAFKAARSRKRRAKRQADYRERVKKRNCTWDIPC